MSEPIKPRIDFDEPLQPPQEPALRAGVAFDAEQAESFFPAAPELQQEPFLRYPACAGRVSSPPLSR